MGLIHVVRERHACYGDRVLSMLGASGVTVMRDHRARVIDSCRLTMLRMRVPAQYAGKWVEQLDMRFSVEQRRGDVVSDVT